MPTSLDRCAEVFDREQWLRLYLTTTRRLHAKVDPAKGRSQLVIGALREVNDRWNITSTGRLKIRYGLMPYFDAWVRRHLQEGDWLMSSFGFVVHAFRDVHERGGRTMIDGGNSHPDNFWSLMKEEYDRWGWRGDPIPRAHHERVLAMLEHTDYIFCPSDFVRQSYLSRGYFPDRLPLTGYPVQLDQFRPHAQRPPVRPFRVLCTGDCSLRKGTPYLLEAFGQLRREGLPIELVLSRSVADDMKRVFETYRSQVTCYQPMPYSELPGLLNSCHAFVLPSIEEGLARAGLEAMSCALPVIVTRNTGLADYVRHGENGQLVPIRDSQALADAIRTLFERPDYAAELGREARETVKQLNPAAYALRLKSEMEKLASMDKPSTTPK